MKTISYLDQYSVYNYYFLIGGLFFSYLIYRIFHTLFGDSNFIHTKYRVRGHTWRSIDCNKSIPYNIYCSVCGILLLPLTGLFCDCCGISACKKCHRTIDKKFRCKQITWPRDKVFHHLWVDVGAGVKDNMSSNEESDTLKKYFCSWCQRIKVSSENLINDTEECDFQKYKNIIIPPKNVQVENGRIVKIVPLLDDDWEPLIIFANRKSGSNRNDEVLSIFRGLLNPMQVLDAAAEPPERAARWLPPRCRVLAAGGDGTAAWVLRALHDAPRLQAPVGVLPTGTGNDLARALGWGAAPPELDAHALAAALRRARVRPLDRWRVSVRARGGGGGGGARELVAHNYCSVGVDAQVALDFARARRLAPSWGRRLNYAAYALLGAGRALDAGGCEGLERRLRVWVRGAGARPERELALPPLQALVVLNVPSWGAGVDLWGLGDEEGFAEQRVDDGLIEVVGVASSLHIARLQCGLARPFRLAQAARVRMELEGRCAMQVDGEPWMQSSAAISVTPAGRSAVLSPRR